MDNTSFDDIPMLSKSRYIKGLQCIRLLWLNNFKPELADPMNISQTALMDTGLQVGLVARERFPNGVLIMEDYQHLAEALISTQKAMSNGALTLYEAAFQHNGVQIRVDILHKVSDNLYDLIEVKSSSKPKSEHSDDLAIQLYVLEGTGISIRKTWLMHINTEYIWSEGIYDFEKLFSLADLTESVKDKQTAVQASLLLLQNTLALEQAPEVKTGKHCKTPQECPFYSHCHKHEPEHPVQYLPRVRQELLNRLSHARIEDIREIPNDFPGIPPQYNRIITAVKSGKPWFSVELATAFDKLQYPLCFIDFESFNPALPLFHNTRPYQPIPFQWSGHILDHNEELTHHEYLHDGLGDPRKGFIESLINLLEGKGSIIVYSSYEKSRLNELKNLFPQHTNAIDSLISRLVDLLEVVKEYCYHPEFKGSFSIKKVLPALVPELGYDDLSIGDGSSASQAYAKMLDSNCPPKKYSELRQALLEYCKRDTLAMVKLFQRLRSVT